MAEIMAFDTVLGSNTNPILCGSSFLNDSFSKKFVLTAIGLTTVTPTPEFLIRSLMILKNPTSRI